MTTPKRIQMSRQNPWRSEHPDAVIVARPSKWGNPFRLGTYTALMREPAALVDAPAEYEGRISAVGNRHDFFWPDGHVTEHTVRAMTREEVVDHYRMLITGNLSPSMVSAGFKHGLFVRHGLPRLTHSDAVNELAGRDLACWCPLDLPCHADVLLEIANGAAA